MNPGIITIYIYLTANQLHRDISEWLKAPNPSYNHNNARQKQTLGTGAWLMQDDRYLKWKHADGKCPILWLHGRRMYLTYNLHNLILLLSWLW